MHWLVIITMVERCVGLRHNEEQHTKLILIRIFSIVSLFLFNVGNIEKVDHLFCFYYYGHVYVNKFLNLIAILLPKTH